ncbi:MAG: TetR family transcriptional regulator [Pelomonas sp.]|nr:TetR family transcriptional regulator [Roseateles sp.]
MKVSKEQAAENRQAILDAAARLFREHGFGGVGVAEITRAAGFTHGGFYRHFESKEALAAEVCALAFERSVDKLEARLGAGGGDATEYFRHYLSPHHVREAGDGCPMPTLAGDGAREHGAVPAALAQGIGHYLQSLARHRPDGTVVAADAPLDDADKARAILCLAALVGGVVLARATHEAAPALSDEILQTLQAELHGLWR